MRKFHGGLTSHIIRTLLAAVLIVSLFGVTGCKSGSSTDLVTDSGRPDTARDDLAAASYAPYTAQDGTWAVYWYICGSDLELRENLSFTPSGQLQEMLNITLPNNVTVVVEAGGAQSWHNDFTDPNVINRFVYQGNTLTPVKSAPLANMGDGQTLADFLDFCNTNYPAEKQAVIIYDHGGGSCLGVSFDDLYDMDGITLPELKQAFGACPAASGAYELVGLSACLMGTIDTMAALNGLTRYYVGSEEVQLGCSWDYGALFGAIAADTAINGAALGRAIADGYMGQCEEFGYTAYTTLSVIDMAYVDELITAYNNVGIELLNGAAANGAEHVARFGRAAYISENYGAIDAATSNYDMVDLGDLVIRSQELLPNSSEAMLRAIDKALVYHVTNPMRADGCGVSGYYPYTANKKLFDEYMKLTTSPAFSYYFDYVFNGVLSEEGQAYLASHSAPEPGPEPGLAGLLPPSSRLDLDNLVPGRGSDALLPGSEGYYVLDLGTDMRNVAAVYLQAGCYDRDTGDYWLYGTHRNLYIDWEKGILCDKSDFTSYEIYETGDGFETTADYEGGHAFTTSFRLDDAYCDYVEVAAEGTGYVLYRVPVLHNNVQKDLMVAYRWTPPGYDKGRFEILGLITQNMISAGVSDPTYEELRVGDVIEPHAPAITFYNYYEDEDYIAENSGFEWGPARQAVTVTENTSFSVHHYAFPGSYMIRFQIIDYAGNVHYSKPGYYLVTPDGKIEMEGLE